MADARRPGSAPQLDIEQLILEAQHRWLRPVEICEILRNYQKFRIAPEPPNKPRSGSIFLFDRKVLRFFRKDGHNWRKKKDGKTVKEAHERLKAESVDVLHCYYAHGEDNENFQRRSYWLLEEDLTHIVLVHYLEVKGNRASLSRTRDAEEIAQFAQGSTPTSSNSFTHHNATPSTAMDTESLNSTQTSEYEDTESDNWQENSRYYPYVALQQHDDGPLRDIYPLNPCVPVPYLGEHQRYQSVTPESEFYSSVEDITRVLDESGQGFTINGPQTEFDLASWEEVLKHSANGFQAALFQPPRSMESTASGNIPQREPARGMQPFLEDLSTSQGDILDTQGISMWQFSAAEVAPFGASANDLRNDLYIDGNINLPSLIKQRSKDLSTGGGVGLEKHDSFSRWMSKELGEVDDSQLHSSSEVWTSVESESILENTSKQQQLGEILISPSLSQDQLFSIIDFSPNHAYSSLRIEVIITGVFLKNRDEVMNCNWSCMFGEIEVPADIISDGILRCYTPQHRPGRVPFYITGSNRLACSEVREFEFSASNDQSVETADHYSGSLDETYLLERFERMLCLESVECFEPIKSGRACLSVDVGCPLTQAGDEQVMMFNQSRGKEFSLASTKDQLNQESLEGKLHAWLLYKVNEDDKGPCVRDKEGQCVLHLAAALGYDWALTPITNAGVNVNFRDVHGWTALHWAAFSGRERTVVFLVDLGAAPGALTDPTPKFPSGRTPADLASMNGHKGIAGFLAEASLTSHLSSLALKDSGGIKIEGESDVSEVENVEERSVFCGDVQAGLPLKDTLSAVRNASQAAARIHQVFRVQSFQRKKLTEYDSDTPEMSEERALSLVSVKPAKHGQPNIPAHVAAMRIQNKFRGWKGRKEFLITRQRIVKIQAHVRGHQVRKHYKPIVWSVGILEKVILRWRRRGSGLRGYRSEGLIENSSTQNQPANDYDFLKEGRKQTEARLEKALARVKSMVQYPEAREQYRRLATKFTELQESKAMQEDMNESEEAAAGDLMTGLEELWEGDSLFPNA